MTDLLRVKHIRFYKGTKSIIGKILFKFKTIYTLELPWLNNKRFKSCIPAGVYLVKKRKPSRKFPYPHWHLVRRLKANKFRLFLDRTWILIHRGNWPKNTTGCILVGMFFKEPMNAVYDSKTALDLMMDNLPDKWELEIVEEF